MFESRTTQSALKENMFKIFFAVFLAVPAAASAKDTPSQVINWPASGPTIVCRCHSIL